MRVFSLAPCVDLAAGPRVPALLFGTPCYRMMLLSILFKVPARRARNTGFRNAGRCVKMFRRNVIKFFS